MASIDSVQKMFPCYKMGTDHLPMESSKVMVEVSPTSKYSVFRFHMCSKFGIPPHKSNMFYHKGPCVTMKDLISLNDADVKSTIEEIGLTEDDVHIVVQAATVPFESVAPTSRDDYSVRGRAYGGGSGTYGGSSGTYGRSSGTYGGSSGGQSYYGGGTGRVSYMSSYAKNDGDLVGLRNQGATCYLNSLLQALYMVPEFRGMLYEWQYKAGQDPEEERCIPLQLQLLFARLQTSEERAESTRELTKSFGWTGADAFQQHDAEELLHVLMDALEVTTDETPQAGVVEKTFKGKTKDYVKCMECDHESARVVPFIDFQVEVNGVEELTEAIHNYVRPERLTDDNAYFCEKCNSKQDALKGLAFLEFPPVLTVSLKRFSFNYQWERREKLNTFFEFPVELDVTEYLSLMDDCIDEADMRTFTPTGENAEFGEEIKQKRIDACERSIASLESLARRYPTHEKWYLKQTKEKKKTLAQLKGEPIPEDDEDEDDKSKWQKRRGGTGIHIDAIKRKDNADVDNADVDNADDDVEGAAPTAVEFPAESSVKKPKIESTFVSMTSAADNVYKLSAVLVHSGGAMGGHYFAYVRVPHTGKWYEFNDSSVKEMTEENLSKAFGNKGGGTASYRNSTSYGTSAYMLIYRRANLDMNMAAPGGAAAPAEDAAAPPGGAADAPDTSTAPPGGAADAPDTSTAPPGGAADAPDTSTAPPARAAAGGASTVAEATTTQDGSAAKEDESKKDGDMVIPEHVLERIKNMTPRP